MVNQSSFRWKVFKSCIRCSYQMIPFTYWNKKLCNYGEVVRVGASHSSSALKSLWTKEVVRDVKNPPEFDTWATTL